MKDLKIRKGKLVFPLRDRIRYRFHMLQWWWMRWTLKPLLKMEKVEREGVVAILKGDD